MKQGYGPHFKDKAHKGSVRTFPQHDPVDEETLALGPIVRALGWGKEGCCLPARSRDQKSKCKKTPTYTLRKKPMDGKKHSQGKESNKLRKMRDLTAKGDVIWTLYKTKWWRKPTGVYFQRSSTCWVMGTWRVRTEWRSNTCSLSVPWPKTWGQLAKITREKDERALVSENESVGR